VYAGLFVRIVVLFRDVGGEAAAAGAGSSNGGGSGGGVLPGVRLRYTAAQGELVYRSGDGGDGGDGGQDSSDGDDEGADVELDNAVVQIHIDRVHAALTASGATTVRVGTVGMALRRDELARELAALLWALAQATGLPAELVDMPGNRSAIVSATGTGNATTGGSPRRDGVDVVIVGTASDGAAVAAWCAAAAGTTFLVFAAATQPPPDPARHTAAYDGQLVGTVHASFGWHEGKQFPHAPYMYLPASLPLVVDQAAACVPAARWLDYAGRSDAAAVGDAWRGRPMFGIAIVADGAAAAQHQPDIASLRGGAAVTMVIATDLLAQHGAGAWGVLADLLTTARFVVIPADPSVSIPASASASSAAAARGGSGGGDPTSLHAALQPHWLIPATLHAGAVPILAVNLAQAVLGDAIFNARRVLVYPAPPPTGAGVAYVTPAVRRLDASSNARADWFARPLLEPSFAPWLSLWCATARAFLASSFASWLAAPPQLLPPAPTLS